jgi:hypothetical protein
MSAKKNEIVEYWRREVDRAIEGVCYQYLTSNHAGSLGSDTEDIAVALGVPARCVEWAQDQEAFDLQQEWKRRKAARELQ